MAGHIILLSGPVGAGKTTIAKELVAQSQGAVSCIEGDLFWSFIARGGETRGRFNNFKMIMASMVAAALPYGVAGYEVIVDFSIPPWFLDHAQRIAKVRDIPLSYIILRPDEAICAARAAARCEGTIADYAPFHDLYTSFDGFEHHTIGDNTGSAADIARRLRNGLDADLFRTR